jgi:hypothetical protein
MLFLPHQSFVSGKHGRALDHGHFDSGISPLHDIVQRDRHSRYDSLLCLHLPSCAAPTSVHGIEPPSQEAPYRHGTFDLQHQQDWKFTKAVKQRGYFDVASISNTHRLLLRSI